MFGDHKGHDVSAISMANNMIKFDIDGAIKEGLLRSTRSSGVLIDIRHTELKIEKTRNRLIKEVRGLFEELIYRLKDREKVVLNHLNTTFDKEVQEIRKEEKRWYPIYP